MWGDPNAEPQDKGDRFAAEDAENRVLIVRPMEYIPDMPVRDTRGDAIKLNIVDLTDDGRVYRGALWFSGRLIKAFKHALGTPFFGYVTKEKLPNGYRGWSFISMAGNADWEPVAQAWSEQNPEFFTEALPEKREYQERQDPQGHHEQGPAPDWAGAVPPRPPAPPAPASRPAPPAPPVSAPPAPRQPMAPPVSAPPASGPGSMLERLQRQARQPLPGSAGNQTPGDSQEIPY